jgi:segregation and condensation protein B
VGHRDVPGKPELLASTKQFLDYFNLKKLSDLPSLAEIKDFDKINPDLFEGLEEVLAQPENEISADQEEVEPVEDIEEAADVIDLVEDENVVAEESNVDATAEIEETSEPEDEEEEVEIVTSDNVVPFSSS